MSVGGSRAESTLAAHTNCFVRSVLRFGCFSERRLAEIATCVPLALAYSGAITSTPWQRNKSVIRLDEVLLSQLWRLQ